MATKVPGYVRHLSKDPVMKRIISKVGPVSLKKRDQVYLRLCESIVSQQLSKKAADTIYNRFLQLYGGAEPSPQQILDTDPERLRTVGFSRAKAQYVQNVARFDLEYGMGVEQLTKMSNDEVISYLTQIKGVGRWTVEVLLMFVLARKDVFAIDDIGIQSAMAMHYGLNRKHKRFKKNLMLIADNWSPYRTFACIYLWRSRSM